jgi:hypothetical protein
VNIGCIQCLLSLEESISSEQASFISFSSLVTLRFTKYNFDDVPGGHTLGFHLSDFCATNRKSTAVSTHTPGQRKTYKTHTEAAVHIYSLAPPANFSGYLEDDRPSLLLYLGLRTLEKNVRVGDLVYVDHSGFYAGGVVLELAPMRREDTGLRRVLVKGAWKDCEVTKGDGAFFYLLVTPDRCAVTARAIPVRWIIDEHPHDQVDITFCGTTIITDPSAPANQFAAWVIKHVAVEQSAQETRRIKDEARCRRVAEELRGRQIIRADHSSAVRA